MKDLENYKVGNNNKSRNESFSEIDEQEVFNQYNINRINNLDNSYEEEDNYTEVDDDLNYNPERDEKIDPETGKFLPIEFDDDEVEEQAQYILDNHKGPYISNYILDSVSNINAIAECFPKYQDIISTIQAEVGFSCTSIAKADHTLTELPNKTTKVALYDGEKEKKMLAESIYKIQVLLNKLQAKAWYDENELQKKIIEKYENELETARRENNEEKAAKAEKNLEAARNRGPVNNYSYRLLKLIENHLKLVTSDEYIKYAILDPDYEISIRSTFLTFPSKLFATGKTIMVNGKEEPEFALDDVRFEEMMKRIPFVEQIEERQDFLTKTLIPYNKMREEGTLTSEDVAEFNKKYREHLDAQKKYFDVISGVKINDPDITANRTFVKNTVKQGFNLNWQTERFGDKVRKRADENLSILERGWPVEDVNLFTAIAAGIKQMENVADYNPPKGDVPIYDSNDMKEAKELLDKTKVLFDKMSKTLITNAEQRDDVLDPLMETFAKFNVVYKRGAKKKASKYRTIDDIAVIKALEEATNRDVQDFEIAKAPIRSYKEERTYGVVGKEKTIVNHVIVGLDYHDIRNYFDIMVDELEAVDPKWMKSSSAFKDMKRELNELNHFLQGTGTSNDNDYDECFKDIKDRIVKVSGYVSAYLDYKEGQIKKENKRLEDDTKQKREQPRIKTAINILEKLNYLSDRIETHFATVDREQENFEKYAKEKLEETRNAGKARLMEKINVENAKILNTEHPIGKNDYMRSLGLIITYYVQSFDSSFNPLKKESYENYVNRVENVGTKDITGDEFTKYMSEYIGIGVIKEFFVNEQENFGKEGHKLATFDDVKNIVNQSIKDIAMRNAFVKEDKPVKENTAIREHAEAVAGYKDRIVSQKNKNKRKQKMEEKKQNVEDINVDKYMHKAKRNGAIAPQK